MFVCLALANPADYDIISSAAIFASSSGLNCGKVIYSSNYMVQLLTSDRTDILVIDTQIEGPDPFECIAKIKSQKPLQVICIAPEADYSCAYSAMKISACELLVRPFTTEQISNALLEAASRCRSGVQNMILPNVNSRNAFAEQISVVLGNKSISEINCSFHTTFREGLFQVVSFAIDFPNINQIHDIAQQLWHSTQTYLYTNAWFKLYDTVHSINYNEIRMIFNYPSSANEEMMQMLTAMFRYVQHACENSPGLELFMGIGQAYADVNKLADSLEESKNAIWTRMATRYPKNRIVTHVDLPISDKQRLNILTLGKAIQNAMDSLNKPTFIQLSNDFFDLPAEALCSAVAKQAILDTVRYFRDTYKERLSQIDNPYNFYLSTKMALLTSQTFDEYKRRYIKIFTQMFDRLSADIENNEQINYIDRVTAIINTRYMEELTLEKVAKEVDISANYLSRIFHKATGKTFSDYLLEQRISAAQILLEKNDCRIKEISSAVGYSDQRYFSRIFMKKLGLTPSEYRSIHQKTT